MSRCQNVWGPKCRWVQHRQVKRVGRQLGPRTFLLGKIGPRTIGSRTIGPPDILAHGLFSPGYQGVFHRLLSLPRVLGVARRGRNNRKNPDERSEEHTQWSKFGPSCPGAQMSMGQIVLGPKCQWAQFSGAPIVRGPNCPGFDKKQMG